MMKITRCPTCGSDRIRQVHRDWHGEHAGEGYLVTGLTFYECPACGEQVFDRDAMRRIESRSPAYTKPAARNVA